MSHLGRGIILQDEHLEFVPLGYVPNGHVVGVGNESRKKMPGRPFLHSAVCERSVKVARAPHQQPMGAPGGAALGRVGRAFSGGFIRSRARRRWAL